VKLDKVIMVRIYLTESEKETKSIVDFLKNETNIRGMSIFRAISGYGETGVHTSSWVDLSLDLPITIEFFDNSEVINLVLDRLNKLVKPKHIVFWEAQTNMK